LKNLQRDVLVITGEQDAIIPPEHVASVRSVLPPHQHVSLDAEHNLLLTHPDSVVNALNHWVSAGAGPGHRGLQAREQPDRRQ
jgi:pimeloyl-ACP methyl ester carboxylesterase